MKLVTTARHFARDTLDRRAAEVLADLVHMSTHGVARKYGVPQATLYGWARKQGVVFNRQGGMPIGSRSPGARGVQVDLP